MPLNSLKMGMVNTHNDREYFLLKNMQYKRRIVMSLNSSLFSFSTKQQRRKDVFMKPLYTSIFEGGYFILFFLFALL